MWKKIIAGGPGRTTRLHDHRGKTVSIGRLVRNGPRALISCLSRVAYNKFPNRPWISYDGQKILERHLHKESRVLEFGSGSSTAWYADRCGFLLSHEHSSEWFDMVGNIVGDRKNVVRKLCLTREEYLQIPDNYRSKPFDLIMIDGKYRDACLDASLEFLSEDGILYLDNSDKSLGDETGDIPAARRKILDYATKNGKRVTTITDFAPSQLFVSEAMILFNK